MKNLIMTVVILFPVLASAQSVIDKVRLTPCNAHVDQIIIPSETSSAYIVRSTGVACASQANCQQPQQAQVDTNRTDEYAVKEISLGETAIYNGVLFSCENH